ncbi:sensor domain-containing diguanylate cyclase [Pontibacillus marinus]|uniref:DeoR family transcriptional regulator n=1 Tax=Pontibacillus marinus BH030004 = DSM 16465 TaxID=1385511 RepID=A0A0A5FZI5_9BACI|nr:diguanylate cyclase [Pontibacillus marinus]KGX84235.1 DeoR family transcriptional regulator [Pontibacillus marinus BH030004 = DSM 16465]
MITNNFQPQIYSDLKVRFYDLFTSKSNRSFEQFLDEMTVEMTKILCPSEIGIYIYDEWEDKFHLKSNATPDSHRIKRSPFTLSEWVEFKGENRLWDTEILNGYQLRNDNNDHSNFVIPLKVENRVFGFLFLAFSDFTFTKEFCTDLQAIGFEVLKVLMKMESYYRTLDEEKKYELLFRVTSKFHSSMNMDDVLAEIIDTLREVYPKFEYYLLLSHDYSTKRDLPIKELMYDQDITSKASAQAYLTGQIQFEDRMDQRKSCLYAPLKGKQGVYGVLQVIAPNSMLFPDDDIEFITLLANTAGNALENARLYQQSKRLISDLQLINETSHKLNSNLRLSETITYMADQIKHSFDAKEVGFVLFKDEEVTSYQILEESTEYFHTAEAEQFIHHLNDRLSNHQDALFIGDFSVKNPNLKCDYQSVMAIPMIQRGTVKGVVIVLHPTPYFFSFETFKLLQSLVHHSTLAFANSMLREELEQLVRTDYLTKLYSRKYLDETISDSISQGTYGVFMIVDIDNFKQINDRYGHQVGDQVIVQVGDLLNETIGSAGIVARWGGEELAIYLPRHSLEQAFAIAEGLRTTIESSTNPTVTISCGVSYWRGNQDNLKDYFIRADKALYEAKEAGKNQVRHEGEMGCIQY